MKSLVVLFSACLCLAACSTPPPTEMPTAPAPAALTPWVSPTPEPTTEPAPEQEASPVLAPTPTPRTHMIEGGEDLGGLALRYQVPLSDLLAANPDINPRAISIGTAIIIPSRDGETSAALPPVAVAGLTVQPARCFLNPAGGLDCFSSVRNESDAPVENISLDFILLDAVGNEAASELSFAPLNLLASGAEMPFLASFAGPLPDSYSVRAELAGALPGSNSPGRYLEHSLEETAASLAPDGLSARVSGRIQLAGGQADASIAWVLATGYNAAGEVVGFRRWEDAAGNEAGQGCSFEFTLYSTGERIERVEFLSEVRP